MSANAGWHTIEAELRSGPAALYRALSVIRRHVQVIEQLTVEPGAQSGTSRLTAVIVAASPERLAKQLVRLVDVVSATASPTESPSERNEPWPSFTTTQMPTSDA